MKFSRLTNIAIRNRHYGLADIGLAASLGCFTLAGIMVFWTF